MADDVPPDFNLKEKYSLIVMPERVLIKPILLKNGVTWTLIKDWDKITRIGATAKKFWIMTR